MGFFADAGPLQIFVSNHLIPEAFEFVSDDEPCYVSDDGTLKIQEGTHVRVQIVGSRVDQQDIVRFASVCINTFMALYCSHITDCCCFMCLFLSADPGCDGAHGCSKTHPLSKNTPSLKTHPLSKITPTAESLGTQAHPSVLRGHHQGGLSGGYRWHCTWERALDGRRCCC